MTYPTIYQFEIHSMQLIQYGLGYNWVASITVNSIRQDAVRQAGLHIWAFPTRLRYSDEDLRHYDSELDKFLMNVESKRRQS